MHRLGHTRSAYRPGHMLLTPDTFVRASLPGMVNATAVVHVGPAAGAKFTEYTAELRAGGSFGPVRQERFVYALEGEIRIGECTLGPGGYAYLPPGFDASVVSADGARAAVIERDYASLEGNAVPEPLFGCENSIAPTLLEDSGIEVRALLPAGAAFDFAVNTLTYPPGAALPMVELHIMEHGLLMLAGGGIYRLGESWYPVTAGDFIWMAPYCPQWFGALGKTPARYLLYKDWNRHPLP